MKREDLIDKAEVVSKGAVELLEQVIVKYTTGILEEVHDQLKTRNAKIKNLEKTLGTLISYLHLQLGTDAATELLKILESDNVK